MWLLKNTYDAKLPKVIVVFKIGLRNSLSYICQAYVVMFIIYFTLYIILYYIIILYYACDVTLSIYPHRASLKNMPGHGGNRTYDLWNTSPTLCQLSYAVMTVKYVMEPS